MQIVQPKFPVNPPVCVCSDIDKHPEENDILQEARRTKEHLEKRFKEAEMSFQMKFKRKTAFRVSKSLRGKKFQSFERGYRFASAALQEKQRF